MFFNPLFISNASTGNIADGTKENKFTNSNYLFADIINVSKEKLSLTEPNIEIDEKNKALFANLKSSNFPLNTKADANTNQFVSDNENLNVFLAKVYEKINASKENVGTTEKNNSKLEATVIPEQITQIIELLNNGEKVSIPLNNNGKIAFVEIQKYDKNLNSENSNKGIKLGSTTQSGIQLTDVDIKRVIADISAALNNGFSTEKFEMSDKKVKDIIAKIETSFSKLVPLKDETFQPQKNILSNLIANIENEFNLDSAASSELKKVIVAQFAKVINEKSGNSVKEANSSDAKMDAGSSTSILKGLNLNPNEEELIKSFNIAVVSPTELKEKIELLLSESSNISELKPILNKINNFLKNNSSQPKENATAEKFTLPEVAKELNLSPKEAAFIKSVTSEKISLPELSKELKAEAIKPNAVPELKSIALKLENYLSNEAIAKPSLTAEKITLPEIAKELNLSPKEVELVKSVTSEKISLPELSKELKAEAIKPNAAPELKSIAIKLENYLSNEAIAKPSSVSEKITLPEIAKQLNLNPKEVELIKSVTTEKISLPELSKELKAEVIKPNAVPELKSVAIKLENYLSNEAIAKPSSTAEKITLPEVAKELNLNPKEVAFVKSVTSEKISLPELSKELKAEVIKPNAAPELKSIAIKLENYLSNEAIAKPSSVSEKITLPEIAKELKLNPKEVELVKSIATEKISLSELSRELKAEIIKPNAAPELKSIALKLENYLSNEAIAKPSSVSEKITLPEIAKELNLTSSESKLVGDLEIEKLDLNELKKSIKAEIISNPNSKELKSLLNKIDSINLDSKSDLGKNQESINKEIFSSKESFEVKPKIVEKDNSEIKNNLNVSTEKPEIKNEKSDYIFTLKNEKSADSLAFDKIVKVETKSPELLKKSIYTSKESIELTKVKVIPINEDVARKMELKSTDDDFKRLSFKKVNTEQKVSNVNDNLKKSFSESDSSKNSANFSQSNVINSDFSKADFSDKNFAKNVSENSKEVNTKTEISKKESVGEAKTNEVKNSETTMPKTAFVENQIRNHDMRVIQKATVKQLDLKNIKEEISSLIQKGEKKSVEFQLNPENLGKMNIKLEIVNKIVSASIKVESETTQQAVQNSLEGLKTSLTQQGVQLSSLSVSLSNSEDKNNRYFKQKRKGNNPMNVKINGLEDKFAHKNLGYNNYDFIA
ncbi:MAG: flagellar hook-length control protein FliK [Bacteroidetes bacterium]|nr:flagellar hook-length control protein FliK [Bacteroidota bacterium]MBU1799320.1 flagellar hook-length control protein FliK [Bacteroidota bacterium]